MNQFFVASRSELQAVAHVDDEESRNIFAVLMGRCISATDNGYVAVIFDVNAKRLQPGTLEKVAWAFAKLDISIEGQLESGEVLDWFFWEGKTSSIRRLILYWGSPEIKPHQAFPPHVIFGE